jgi:hypothetical protein
MSARSFPGPWRVDVTEGGHFVKDATGFSICYVSPAISHRASVVRAGAVYREAKTRQTMTVSGSCRLGAARTETHFFARRR